ncbi:MAG: hypothetical protein ACR2QO_02915 [Acidimicrobiales bacterium]
MDSSEYYDEDVDPDHEDEFDQDYDQEFWEDDEDESTPRERWLKIALLAIAAGLAATIITLLTQSSDDDADVSTETGESADVTEQDGTNSVTTAAGAATTTAAGQAAPPAPAAGSATAAESGTATIDIGVLTETGGQAVEVATQFDGADFDTTVTFLGDPENYSGSPSVQGLRFTGGSYYYRPSAAEDWQAASDSSSVSLNEGIVLPTTIVGWSTGGLDELFAAAGIAPTADGQPATGALTVAQARSLAVLPPPVAIVAGEEWEWRHDQPITITASFTSGLLTNLDVLASDDDPDRITGALTVSATTTYSNLNAGTPIPAP